MNIHLRITFLACKTKILFFAKPAAGRFKFVKKSILLKVTKLYHQCCECLRTGLWVLFHLEKDLMITFDLADNNRKNDPKRVSWGNRPTAGFAKNKILVLQAKNSYSKMYIHSMVQHRHVSHICQTRCYRKPFKKFNF